MNKVGVNIFCMFLGALFAFKVLAEGGDKPIYGIVDAVFHEQSAVVIDDTYLSMSLSLKVFDHRGDTVNRYSLKLGQKVAYEREGSSKVATIWIKPKGFKLPVNDD
ncbi:hypothetical protein R50073_05240 [Maricurvus nonylphenolicus]|uniref:hypothetical protein n=1 Tax=Maricurvus nonylphenolicus TaxID=1008307 RepID=UPI0036F25C0F